MEALIPIAFIIGISFLVVGLIWWSYVMEQKRRELLEAAADEMGLQYSRDGDPTVFDAVARFQACSTGRSRKLFNLIQGETDEVSISIFDYRYTTGSGKNSHTYNHTMVFLRSTKLVNPPFTMRPEGFFDRIGGALGFQDIDFESHPRFSEMFVLKSPDEEGTRKYFCASMLEFFESRPAVCVEADPGAMVFYRPRKRCKPEELRDLFEEAYLVFGAMVDRGKN